MSYEMFAYPFLFLAIFFETFVLVTLLSKPARDARSRPAGGSNGHLPSVAVIVPCYNEESTVAATCDSILSLNYPRDLLEVILVNDGSTDNTKHIMSRFDENPRVRIIHKENGGKHTALNAGIALTEAEIVGCLDADSFVEKDALLEIVSCFNDPKVSAATSAMSVHKPHTLLQHMQSAEYIFGISLRHTLASVNGLYVTPGPFSFYRRSVFAEIGGFRHGHQTEDMEMALRIQRAGYRIENAPHARVYTKAPDTFGKLLKQRVRWTTGFIRNVLGEYKPLVLDKRHGALGMIVLPFAIAAVGGGILMFFSVVATSASRIAAALEIRAGIPISYAISPHGSFFDWFYMPISIYIMLCLFVIIASVSLMLAGKRISQTPGKMIPGVISYVLLYGIVAPLWLLRSTADVTLGKYRNWR